MEQENKQSDMQLYGSFSTYALTVNYIVGVGILSCPFAFYSSGVVLGVIIMAVVTIVSYITMIWLLESLSRMNALFYLGRYHHKHHRIHSDDPTDSFLQTSDEDEDEDEQDDHIFHKKRPIRVNTRTHYRVQTPADEFTLVSYLISATKTKNQKKQKKQKNKNKKKKQKKQKKKQINKTNKQKQINKNKKKKQKNKKQKTTKNKKKEKKKDFF